MLIYFFVSNSPHVGKEFSIFGTEEFCTEA